jgi:alkaline phosphatase D
MPQSKSRRDFIRNSATVLTAASAASLLSACGGSNDTAPQAADFRYGVASGDPLSDRVILWTHARIASTNEAVELTWQTATDAGFRAIVSTGRVRASADTGFTAKADATGLAAGTLYYYRFIDAAGAASPVGITRTLPKADVSSVKFAVLSCSLYSEGFFNTYAAAANSDAEYALHLGDYIYEYGSDPAKYGNADAVALNRVTAPANDIVSLEDYRTRYARYRSDTDLQALHARMPFIAVWDDHEFANNAYLDGAENHDSATQGDWAARKTAAAQAYHEWLPIRTDAGGDRLKIYRRFDFGQLLTLHMLDTRIEGRDRQYDGFGDTDGGIARYAAGLGSGSDANRRMISAAQQGWLVDGIRQSSAAWQVLGNQDIMARMWMPASVLQAQQAALTNPTVASQAAVQTAISDFLAAKVSRAAGLSLTPTQMALLSPTTNPRLPYNLDAWDGYPLQRESILQSVKTLDKRLVTLSGDSHNGWFADLTTLAGESVGVEFACASVTSPGFEGMGLGSLAPVLDGSAAVAQLGTAAIGAGLGLVDDLNYADTRQRGYLQFTVTANEVKGEYIYVSTIKSTNYTTQVGRTITVSDAGAVSYG